MVTKREKKKTESEVKEKKRFEPSTLCVSTKEKKRYVGYSRGGESDPGTAHKRTYLSRVSGKGERRKAYGRGILVRKNSQRKD